MPEKTDQEIALAVQEGDRESFGLLVERYESRLIRYGRKFLLESADIEDRVQEVFIKAYIAIQSFDAGRPFFPWIYRIAHNEFINAGTRGWRRNIFAFDFDMLFPHPAARETADGGAHARDLKRMLDSYLGAIDAKYREPLVLYYFEDLSYGEIAEIMHTPSSTVGVRLQRGRAMVKKMLARDGIAYE